MYDDLEKCIIFIREQCNNMNEFWEAFYQGCFLNLKKIHVHDVSSNSELLDYIFIYREFVSEKLSGVLLDRIQELDLRYSVYSRIKTLNSIQDKIGRYVRKKERGKIPLNKCVNDILGFRIILEDFDFDDIISFIKEKFQELKLIDASKGDYRAVHVYFSKGDNKKFPWELQIWSMKDRETNLKSHADYKQQYIVWEDD